MIKHKTKRSWELQAIFRQEWPPSYTKKYIVSFISVPKGHKLKARRKK